MRRIALALVVLSLLVGLTGCGPKVHEGVVIAKEHHDAFSTVILIPEMVGKTTVLMPVTQFYPEEWTIHIKGVSTEHKVSETSFDVSGWTEYNKYEVGQEVENPDAK